MSNIRNISANDNRPKTPAFYTENEGGHWISWTAKAVKKEDLKNSKRLDRTHVEINNIIVHSILFPTLNPYKFVRWDCINGITGIITDQNLGDNFSNGK